MVSAAMDAIINAGPSRRATKAANEMAEVMSIDALNTSLVERLRAQAAEQEQQGVRFADVQTVQKLTSPAVRNGAVEIVTSYRLSEDASTLRVSAEATYSNASTPYVAPYFAGGSPPKSETKGPAYKNTFTFYSTQLPVPVFTPELKADLIESIEASYRSADGTPPAADSTDFKAMTKEVEKARDNELTKDEIAIFLTRRWLEDDGARIKAEVAAAHDFIARYVLLDLNNTAVPSISGQDEVLETQTDGRIVRRVGAGVTAGTYISSAGNISSFASYGNTTAVAERHRNRMAIIRARAKS